MASQVADILQLMLMDLSLDSVPVAMEKDHTPTPAVSIPQLLVSSVNGEEPPCGDGCGSKPQGPRPSEDESSSIGVVKEAKSVEEEELKEEKQQQEMVEQEMELSGKDKSR